MNNEKLDLEKLYNEIKNINIRIFWIYMLMLGFIALIIFRQN